MKPSIFPYERRKKAKPHRWLALALGTVLFVLVFVAQPYLSPVIARSETPVRDYPHDNRGTCIRFHDHPAPIHGADLKAVKELCAGEGINL